MAPHKRVSFEIRSADNVLLCSGNDLTDITTAKMACYQSIASLARSYTHGLRLGAVLIHSEQPDGTVLHYRMDACGIFSKLPFTTSTRPARTG